jgi:soluble lytic murein transglycosylase-like protein
MTLFSPVQKWFEKCVSWIDESAWEVGVDRYLVAAIAWKETDYNPTATRYEPEFKKRYIDKISNNDLYKLCPGLEPENILLERTNRATSWGLMQIMGQTARELGLTQPDMSFWLQGYMGVYYGVKYLDKKLQKYELPDAISAYNAGTPTERNRLDYVEPVLLRLKILRNESLVQEIFKEITP